MKKFVCQTSTLLLLGWCATSATANERNDATATCRQETKRVVVWPHGSPKAAPMARIEKREVTVCDPKVAKS